MASYVARRLIIMIPVILLVTMVAFSLRAIIPGDPIRLLIGDLGSKEQYDAAKKELGLDRPVPLQYWRWLSGVVRGDWGRSTKTNQPVLEALALRLEPTMELGILAFVLSICIAVPVGSLAAVRPNSLTDILARAFATTGFAMPPFWIGLMMILFFSLVLRWLPPGGYVPFFKDPQENLKLMILPAFNLSLVLMPVVTRQVRASMSEVLAQEYITTARSKGIKERLVIQRHALKNALIPVASVLGLQVGVLFGGAAITETIFAIPGMGRLAVDAIYSRDFPTVQGVVLFMSIVVLFANLTVDLIYGYLDPRVKYFR